MPTAALRSAMSDRSDEVTERRDVATDDLLAETDDLLSASDADTDADGVGNGSSAGADDSFRGSDLGAETGFDRGAAAEPDPEEGGDTDSSRSLLAPLTSRLSLNRYFSPKAYLALVLAFGVGLVGGASVLPVAGRLIGTLAVAFLVGLLASKRRYLEVGAAGVSVGGVAALLTNTVLVAAGSGRTLVAVGATVGFLAAVTGYYFGRDLRDGLSREVD